MQKIYRGWLVEADWGEGMDILWLLPQPVPPGRWPEDPLAQEIESDMDENGRFLSVRYYVAPEQFEPESVVGFVAMLMAGEGYSDVGHAYSEITGYLWTDEKINVGGHDLIAELHDHKGKFLHLEIEFSQEGVGAPKGKNAQ